MIGWNRGGVAEICHNCIRKGSSQRIDQVALFNAVQLHLEIPQSVTPVELFSLADMCHQTLDLYQQVLQSKHT